MSARRPHRPDVTPTPASPSAPRLLSRKDPLYPHRGGSAAGDRMVAGGLAGVQGLGPDVGGEGQTEYRSIDELSFYRKSTYPRCSKVCALLLVQQCALSDCCQCRRDPHLVIVGRPFNFCCYIDFG
jgi:hypothetical protein